MDHGIHTGIDLGEQFFSPDIPEKFLSLPANKLIINYRN